MIKSKYTAIILFYFILFYFIKKMFLTFIYFWDRERQSMNGGGSERERETQNPKQAPGSELSAQSLTRGLNSRTARSWPEPKLDAQPTEPPRHPKNSFFLMFIYFIFETERDRAWTGEGQRERGRHRIWNRLQALSCQHRARRGAWTHGPRDHDLSRSRPLNRLSHPGAPLSIS